MLVYMLVVPSAMGNDGRRSRATGDVDDRSEDVWVFGYGSAERIRGDRERLRPQPEIDRARHGAA